MKINRQIECYLTDEAKAILDQMEKQGWDRDLILEFLESTCNENEVWKLDDYDGQPA